MGGNLFVDMPFRKDELNIVELAYLSNVDHFSVLNVHIQRLAFGNMVSPHLVHHSSMREISSGKGTGMHFSSNALKVPTSFKSTIEDPWII